MSAYYQIATIQTFQIDFNLQKPMNTITFNKPYMTGKETHYMYKAVESGKISGNGIYTQKCQRLFEEKFSFRKTLLTTSCTDALEMAAILLDIQPDDEVIVPSFTFVSTANAFVLHGAKIVFADSETDTPNIDADKIEALITSKTKAIVPVQYAGMACDMKKIMEIATRHGIFVVEDAAQAIDSYHNGQALGSIGHLAAFSFHETKNIISGEGGMLVINDERFSQRAEIIWEKGTNRAAFFRGDVNKYGWVDKGSSFLPSDIIAAFLYAQLENLEIIQTQRKLLWDNYLKNLKSLEIEGFINLPRVPKYATNNAHMFYITVSNLDVRTRLIAHLKANRIMAVFHYLSLHKSPFYAEKHDGRDLTQSDIFEETIIRLPLFFELSLGELKKVTDSINDFFLERRVN